MDFNKYSQYKDMFNNMSPEMKAQMMKMAKEQMKVRVTTFAKKWFALPVLTIAGVLLGAVVGAFMACFGDILLKVSEIRSEHPLYFIPALAIIGMGIVFAYKKWGEGSERGMGLIFAVGQRKENNIPLVLIPLVTITTWATHLFGGSAGREGVAVQIGATFGHNLSKKLPLEGASQTMLIAGMAAGFGGLFQVPMAATAFALEVLIVGRLELYALLPAAAAAFTACKVSSMLGLEKFSVDLTTLLGDQSIGFLTNTENGLSFDINFALKLAVLGLIFGLVGAAFAKVLSLAKNFFAKKSPNPIKRIAVMGVVLSAVFLLLWQGRYSGLGTNLIDLSFAGDSAASIYGADWILKFALTILTLAAGFQGGEVTPLFSIGATLGTVSASLVGLPLPLAAALGYAAVFGSASNTLWAPILIGVEVFGPEYMPAFFIVCLVSYVCNFGQSIYKQQKLKLH